MKISHTHVERTECVYVCVCSVLCVEFLLALTQRHRHTRLFRWHTHPVTVAAKFHSACWWNWSWICTYVLFCRKHPRHLLLPFFKQFEVTQPSACSHRMTGIEIKPATEINESPRTRAIRTHPCGPAFNFIPNVTPSPEAFGSNCSLSSGEVS